MADDSTKPPPPEQPQAPPAPRPVPPPGPVGTPASYSNYPRAPLFRAWYNRPPGVYFDSIGTAFDMMRANWGLYAACTLIFFLILGGISYPLVIGSVILTLGSPILTTLVGAPVSVVSMFMTLCMISVGVEHARGVQPGMDSFFLPFRRFGPALAASALASIPIVITRFFLVLMQSQFHAATHGSDLNIPVLVTLGVLLAIAGILQLLTHGALMLAATAAVFSDYQPIEAFAETIKRGGPKLLLFSLLFVVASIAAGLGVILCGVGILFTYAIMPNVVALHYLYYFPSESRTQPVQPAWQA